MKWSEMSDDDKLELVKEILARAYAGRNGATSSKSWTDQDIRWYREDALDEIIKRCKEVVE